MQKKKRRPTKKDRRPGPATAGRPDTPPPPPPRREGRVERPGVPRPRRSLAIGLALVIVAAALGPVLFYRAVGGEGYPLDDSWIHLTFARNLAQGAGFGANPGETTPGATSPLWVVLLSTGFLLGAGHAVWPWWLATLSLGGAGLAAATLVSRSVRRDGPNITMGVACGLAIVWTGPLVWSAAGAMEVPLFVALVLVTLLHFEREGETSFRRSLLWGGTAGLAALARPEGLLLVPLLAGASIIRFGRRGFWAALSGGVASLVVYSPSAILCLTTSGRLFPNTFYAKTTSLVAGAPDVGFLSGAVGLIWALSPVAMLLFLLSVPFVVLAIRRGDLPGGIFVAAGFVVALPLAYGVMGRTFLFAGLAGNFGRYLYPVLPLALALGYWALARLSVLSTGRLMRLLTVTAAILVPAFALGATVGRADLYRRNVYDINSMQVAMAHRLEEHLPPGSLVAANDVGAIAFLTDFRVLDLFGIISTPTLNALEGVNDRPSAKEHAYYRLLLEERPEAIVVFPRWFGGTLRRLGSAVEQIDEVNNPLNITSGSSRLLAYRIDWSRVSPSK